VTGDDEPDAERHHDDNHSGALDPQIYEDFEELCRIVRALQEETEPDGA
jgi:hypothetical protein